MNKTTGPLWVGVCECVSVCVCAHSGVGLEWLLEQIISAAISWTDRLMLHRLSYLS